MPFVVRLLSSKASCKLPLKPTSDVLAAHSARREGRRCEGGGTLDAGRWLAYDAPMHTPIRTYTSLPSTNAEAMRLGLAGELLPLWVRAERQTAGRGRNGRAWVSEPGNLYASLAVRLACAPIVLHQLSFVAAVATLAAIRRSAAADFPLKLKWPNDILLDGAKLTGILAESTLQANGAILAVIGIGVNLAHAPNGLGRATTCLAAHGHAITPAAMLDALAAEMERALALWADGTGFAAIHECWLQDSLPLGTAMSVHVGETLHHGTFAGIATDGALILRDHSGYDTRLSTGDVTIDAARGG
jgi:BirA family transcriptional regulator, biotin operon repressor / biotin---[acetyl-CoA-carboxylase] ligase